MREEISQIWIQTVIALTEPPASVCAELPQIIFHSPEKLYTAECWLYYLKAFKRYRGLWCHFLYIFRYSVLIYYHHLFRLNQQKIDHCLIRHKKVVTLGEWISAILAIAITTELLLSPPDHHGSNPARGLLRSDSADTECPRPWLSPQWENWNIRGVDWSML